MAVPAGYKTRLKTLLDTAREMRGAEGSPISLRQLAALMLPESDPQADAIEKLRKRVWFWLNSEMKRTLKGENLTLLSRVDPKGRTPAEIQAYLEGVPVQEVLGRDFVSPSSAQLEALQTQVETLKFFVRFLLLERGASLIPSLATKLTQLTGAPLEELVDYSSESSEVGKERLLRVLRGESVSEEELTLSWAPVVTLVNRLLTDNPELYLSAPQLRWLCADSSTALNLNPQQEDALEDSLSLK